MKRILLDLTKKTQLRIDFETILRNRVVGQETAVEAMSHAFELVESGMVDKSKPLANMLFLGPTGVGKTLMAETVAEAILGSTQFITKINCAEYSEDHQIARIIGAPPGYIGFDTVEPVISPTSLSRGWTKDGPHISILLFDEIEKASPRLWQLLLGILDKAEISTSSPRQDATTGPAIRTLNLGHCFVFLTSNVGSRAINGEHIGFSDTKTNFAEISAEAKSAAKTKFEPEFLARLDHIVVFNNLNEEHLSKILSLEIMKVWQRALDTMAKPGDTDKRIFVLRITPRFRKFLLSAGPEKKYGARNLRGVVTEYVTQPLATILATKQITTPGVVTLDRPEKTGKINMTFKEYKSKLILPVTADFSEPNTVVRSSN